MRPGIWKALKRGDDRQTILAVDFREARSEPGFAELAANCMAATEIWQVDEDLWRQGAPLAPDTRPRTPAAALADTWFSAVTGLAGSRRITAVMAYCAGASLACALADRIAEDGQPPPAVVLFDPFEVDEQVLRHSLRSAIKSFGSDLDADAVERIAATVDQPLLDIEPGGAPHGGSTGDTGPVPDGDGRTGELERLAGRISQAYRDLMSLAARRFDLSSALVQELGDKFVAYQRYLVAASSSPIRYHLGRAFVVLSESHGPPALSGFRELRFAVAADDLLDDRVVAQGVLDALATARTHRASDG